MLIVSKYATFLLTPSFFYILFIIEIDVDYCALGHNCDVNAKCFNLNTSYTCKCNKGFQGDGYQCTG